MINDTGREIPQQVKNSIRSIYGGTFHEEETIEAAEFGYSLAQSEIEKLKAENLKLANEVERLKEAYHKATGTFFTNAFNNLTP